nr:MAG TPA: hypothetical protein [Caudoviricetes sp.]
MKFIIITRCKSKKFLSRGLKFSKSNFINYVRCIINFTISYNL